MKSTAALLFFISLLLQLNSIEPNRIGRLLTGCFRQRRTNSAYRTTLTSAASARHPFIASFVKEAS